MRQGGSGSAAWAAWVATSSHDDLEPGHFFGRRGTTPVRVVRVAAHVANHEHHEIAADAAAGATHVLGQVAVESWSVLRRHFRLSADVVASMLLAYTQGRTIVSPTPQAYARVLERGAPLLLAGNVHDALIVQTAGGAGLRLATLDAGVRRLAAGLADCTLLRP